VRKLKRLGEEERNREKWYDINKVIISVEEKENIGKEGKRERGKEGKRERGKEDEIVRERDI
jgi:hypothetical protein